MTETRIVRTRSIPNVDSERLQADLTRLCAMFHGTGVLTHDGPRRDLVNNGRKMVAIATELDRRGIRARCCPVLERCFP